MDNRRLGGPARAGTCPKMRQILCRCKRLDLPGIRSVRLPCHPDVFTGVLAGVLTR